MASSQFRKSKYRQNAPQPDLPGKADTSSSRMIQDIASSDLPADHLAIAELDTLQIPAVRQPVPGSSPNQLRGPQYPPVPDEAATMFAATNQETFLMPTIADQETNVLPIALAAPPINDNPMRRVAHAVLSRLQEPQPEGLLTRGVQVVRLKEGLGRSPILAVTNALGVLVVSLSYFISVLEYTYPIVESCFLAGLLLISLPNMMRLLARTPTRPERLCSLAVLAGCSFFIQYMTSPTRFSTFDDFLHLRTVEDILGTGHLFSFNSMLPVSPYYPGLEIVTSSISTTTGLSPFYAGNIVILTAHLLMGLALYLFYEHLTSSSRMASIATLIYAVNPHFFFFDGYYNYETLALPLATFLIYLLIRYADAGKNYRWVKVIPWIVLAALTITHHMTDYFFVSLLFLWAIVSFFRPTPRGTRIQLLSLAIVGLTAAMSYALLMPGNPVWSYLSEYFGPVFGQLQQFILGNGTSRMLFANNSLELPIWDKFLITSVVVIITLSLPFGLLVIRRLYRNNVLAIVFGLLAQGYPFTQAFRFTSFGTEITDRSAAFLFVPIAFVLTVLITHLWPTRRLKERTIALVTCLVSVLYIGNNIMATSPNLTALPGPYLVVADARSVEPEGINAAIWAQQYLGPNNHVATDRVNQMLMNTYGHQRIITRLGDNEDISPIFYSAQFDAYDLALMHEENIRYLVIDTRLSDGLPVELTYFENDSPVHVISKAALLKFNTVSHVNRIFDTGDIVIYDAEALLNGASP